MPITKFSTVGDQARPRELPAEGFPYGEQSLRDWFRKKYGREAMDVEIGALMAAMAARDGGVEPDETSAEPGGWSVERAGPL